MLQNQEIFYIKVLAHESSQKALLFAGQLVPHHVKRFDVSPLVGHRFICIEIGGNHRIS